MLAKAAQLGHRTAAAAPAKLYEPRVQLVQLEGSQLRLWCIGRSTLQPQVARGCNPRCERAIRCARGCNPIVPTAVKKAGAAPRAASAASTTRIASTSHGGSPPPTPPSPASSSSSPASLLARSSRRIRSRLSADAASTACARDTATSPLPTARATLAPARTHRVAAVECCCCTASAACTRSTSACAAERAASEPRRDHAVVALTLTCARCACARAAATTACARSHSSACCSAAASSATAAACLSPASFSLAFRTSPSVSSERCRAAFAAAVMSTAASSEDASVLAASLSQSGSCSLGTLISGGRDSRDSLLPSSEECSVVKSGLDIGYLASAAVRSLACAAVRSLQPVKALLCEPSAVCTPTWHQPATQPVAGCLLYAKIQQLLQLYQVLSEGGAGLRIVHAVQALRCDRHAVLGEASVIDRAPADEAVVELHGLLEPRAAVPVRSEDVERRSVAEHDPRVVEHMLVEVLPSGRGRG
eukprot:scaffold42594_cov64-Phaeocystis_antarctica.AAC.7